MEFFDVGSTRVVLLKKCASSSLHAMLRHRRRGQLPSASKYVITFMRDPYARLVSGWADLVRRCNHPFAIPRNFPSDRDPHVFGHWVREIVKVPDEELDHHFRPQYLELLDALDLADLRSDCELIIGKVEHLDTHLPVIRKYVGGEPFAKIEHRRKSSYGEVSGYYVDEDIHARVHARFMRDEMLYHKIGNDPYFTPVDEDPRDHLKALLHMG